MNGRLIISLDFELHWGQFDHVPITRDSIDLFKRTRALIPLLLDRFEQRGIHATWATVGALFARNRDELLQYLPKPRPQYKDGRFDIKNRVIDENLLGKDEKHDPCHFAYSLVRNIQDTPGQEVGSHTFAHVFALEEGFASEDLEADLNAAQSIAEETIGQSLHSLVFPRNQYSDEFIPVLKESGIKTFRTNPSRWYWQPRSKKRDYLHRRIFRYGDDYLPLSASLPSTKTRFNGHTGKSSEVIAQSFSRFLRPPLHMFDRMVLGEWLKTHRIKSEMTKMARKGGVYHLWWHPHNMAVSSDQSFEIIDSILDHYTSLRDRYGMESQTMFEYAEEIMET